MLKKCLIAVVMLVAVASAAAAQTTYIVVRHAERADTGSGGMNSDPDLSAAGRARAESLAAMLKSMKLTAVFTTEFKRTQQTAGPTVQDHQLTPVTVPSAQTPALVKKLKAATGTVLVVGHSNTVPDVLTGLGVKPAITIPDTEFDNLFIVVAGKRPTLVTLKYK